MELVLEVPWLRCRDDVRLLGTCLRDVAGVRTVVVDLDKGTARVGGDAGIAPAVRAAADRAWALRTQPSGALDRPG